MAEWKFDIIDRVQRGQSPEVAAQAVSAAHGVEYALALTGAQYARDSFKGQVPAMEAKLAALREQSANLLMVTIPQAEMAVESAKIAAGARDE